MKTGFNIKEQKGFSLVELAWTMIILGLLVALTVPAFSKFLQSSRLNGASSDLIADIHYVSSLALMRHKTYQIVFQPGQYCIIETATGTVIKTQTVPSGFALAASANPSFYAWGLTQAATITISTGSKSQSLVLSSTGSVVCE